MPTIPNALQQPLAAVRAIVFDVDGVLTDGGLIVGERGEEYKRFHARDGHGIKMLQDSGVAVAIITGRQSAIVTHRCEELGIAHLYQGCHDKREAFARLTATLGLSPAQFACMGDDLVDLPVMCRVGVSMTVANAAEFVLRQAHWISSRNGGDGAAREACELIMQAQGTLPAVLAQYLR